MREMRALRLPAMPSPAFVYPLLVRRVLLASLLFGTLLSCHRERYWESVCQVVRRDVVEEDDKGKVTQIDVELEWDPCPGDQFQVLRGGAEFAACMSKYEVGAFVPVKVKQWWDTRGFYTWDIYQVGECRRDIEPFTEGSFERSQECSETKSFGHVNGFTCNRKPFAKLVSICPWMARD